MNEIEYTLYQQNTNDPRNTQTNQSASYLGIERIRENLESDNDALERTLDSNGIEHSRLDKQFQELVENAPFPIIISRVSDGTLQYGNQRALSQLNITSTEGVGRPARDFYVHEKERTRFLEHLNRDGHVYDFEVSLYDNHRNVFNALMSASFTLYANERAVIVTINDISERTHATEALKIEKEKYRLLTETMADVISVYNFTKSTFDFISPSITALCGYTVEEALARSVSDNMDSSDYHRLDLFYRTEIKRFLEDPKNTQSSLLEYQQKHKNGSKVWVEIASRIRRNAWGDIEVISSTRDISMRKHMESRNEFLSLHDVHTHLLNKTAFRLFEDECLETDLIQSSYAIFYIDFDNFGLINDAYGHLFGDRLIVEIAQNLKDYVGQSGQIYHFSGDEFVVFKYVSNMEEADSFAKGLSRVISQQLLIMEQTYVMTSSIGYFVGDRCAKISDSIRNAFSALFEAKRIRNTIKVYNENMHNKQTREAILEKDLSRALDNQEFEIYLQPIYDVTEHAIHHAEALLRWNHPVFGQVSPIEFIPIAEQNRMIIPITDWVIHQACAILGDWNEAILGKLSISVNISFITLTNRGEELYDHIRREIALSGIDPHRLKLELTESSLVLDAGEVIRVFIRLKELGLNLSLDDFGTGYSSFGYLKALPLDEVKIDRVLVNSIDKNAKARMIMESMLTILHGLDLKVVIEGVEDKEQFEILRSLNADLIQGYLFAKPMTFTAFKRYYDDQHLNTLPVSPIASHISAFSLVWREEWNSGHNEIDIEHQAILKMAEQLDAIVTCVPLDVQVFKNFVERMFETIANHFEHEEAILLEKGYSGFDEHRYEHQKALEEAQVLWNSYLSDAIDAQSFILHFIRNIVWDHLVHEDVKFFPYVKNNQTQFIHYLPFENNFEQNEPRALNRNILLHDAQLREVLAAISTRFIQVDIQDIDHKINQTLEQCAKQVEADRAYIFRYDWTTNICQNTYEWCQDGISSEIDNLQAVCLDEIPDWVNAHILGETVAVQDVSLLAEDNRIRMLLEPQGVQSLLAVPMMIDNVCVGFVGFDSVRNKRSYSIFERMILNEVIHVILAAMKRVELEDALNKEKAINLILCDHASDAILRINYFGLINTMNANAKILFDMSLDTFKMRNVEEFLYYWNDKDERYDRFDWVNLYKRNPQFPTGFMIKNKDGSMKHLAGSIIPLGNPKLDKCEAMILLRDIER